MERISSFSFREASFAGERGLSPEDQEKLRPHVVNLRFGVLSSSGQFQTTVEDLDQIFDEEIKSEMKKAKDEGRKFKLLLYAHGGLVSESAGLGVALDQVQFWKDNGIYPLFFVWETGLFESIADLLRKELVGARGFFGDVLDKVIEAAARPAGLRVWTQMKRSAETAVLDGGGALPVIDRTLALAKSHSDDLEIHAAGHSAGSIFHTFFLPALLDRAAGAITVKTLHFLAPAVNIPVFKSRLAKRIGSGIGSLSMYTMKRSYERKDTVGPYRKSLLYLVHHAFEDPDGVPILGLEENLRADNDLTRLFGLVGSPAGPAEVAFSVTGDSAALRNSSRSTSHGGFDNDPPTMNSICRRVLNVGDGTAIREYSASRALITNELDLLAAELGISAPAPALTAQRTFAGGRGWGAINFTGETNVGDLGAETGSGTPSAHTSPSVKRRALCIGINAYASPNELNGCVADARMWADSLRSMGFTVQMLLDADATREGILSCLNDLVAETHPGDVAVFQYAGHGTQFPDQSGEEPDARDEAFCPVDMLTQGFILDDAVRPILDRLPEGTGLTSFIDCCHSGTIVRGFRELSTRTLPRSRARFVRATPEMVALYNRTKNKKKQRSTVIARSVRRDVLFSACHDAEVAFEIDGHGEFTVRATRVLQAGSGLTNRAFCDQVIQAFGSDPRQHPQLDCPPHLAGRVLFAV